MISRRLFYGLFFSLSVFAASLTVRAEPDQQCADVFSWDAISCRIHGFEFCTSDRISASLRSKVFDALGRVQSKLGFETVVKTIVRNHLADLDRHHGRKVHLIELGSGAGDLVLQLAKDDVSRKYLLTDIFPQVEVWQRKIADEGSSLNVQYLSRPTSATDLAKLGTVSGEVILTVAMLHHLRPEEVEAFLKQVVQQQLNVIIVEPLARRLRDVFIGAGAGLVSLKLYPEGWLDPRAPFILSHDGVVSALRQYTADELRTKLLGTGYQVTETAGLGPVGSFRVMVLRAP
jgi:hypothetical protein